jgi:threonyl-tRNA synthetase
MTEDQIESEVVNLIAFIDRMYKVFGLTYDIELSTRPEEKYIGDIKNWDAAEDALAKACVKAGKVVKVNPGDGAFYGPKLDFHVNDSLGREWQCGTIQLDFNLPERFDCTYVAADGTKKRPVMLHRVIFGSVERFIGILIEHFAGNFPTWMAPVQVSLIPVNNTYHLEYAEELKKLLMDNYIRVELDSRDEKLGYKMRETQMKKIPYTLVLGDNEKENNTVTYRKHGTDNKVTVSKEEFIKLIKEQIESKSL